MARYEDITSVLLSVCRSKTARLEEELAAIVASGGVASGGDAQQISQLEMELEEEKTSRAKQAFENVRRRHNFTPFVISLLKALAKKDALAPMVDKAKERRTTNAAAAAAEAKK